MATKTLRLHKFQDEAIFAPQRFKAIVAGLQSGKTIAGAVWARMQFDQFPEDAGLIAAPTYKILEQSTLPKFFEINPDLKRFYHKSDSCIEVPNRGVIYIRSVENPNVIEGMTLRWIWPDEAGQMKLDAWVNFQGRLSILQGSMLATTTPYTMNWLYNDFFQKWKEGNKDYLVVQFRSCDNPYFPAEEYERVKNSMDGRTFRRRYDGMFEKMEGLVYEDFSPTVNVIDPLNLKFKEVILGADWGYVHQTALVVIGITADNHYYVIEEYYETGKITSEIIERMKYLIRKYKIRFVYPDPAEKDRLEEMKRAGIFPRDVVKNKDSIVRGIDDIRALIKEGRFHIFKTCPHIIDEFCTYHYDLYKEGERTKENPVKEDDDLMDALRYPIMMYTPAKSYIKKDKSYISNNLVTGY